MHIRLTTSCWGHEMVFEMDTGEPGEETKPESGITKRFLKVVNGYRGNETLEVTEVDFQPLLAIIARSRISPFVSGPMGLDGVTYILTLSEGTSTSSFEWWTEAEKDWRALDRIARELISLAEKKAGKPFPMFGAE